MKTMLFITGELYSVSKRAQTGYITDCISKVTLLLQIHQNQKTSFLGDVVFE